MKDKLFKSFNHSCNGYCKFLSGQALEQGYKPDFVLKRGNEYIILELENSSSRKTFVGGMIKAAHFLQQEKEGILIFVIKPKENTKVSSISKHLIPYFDWISEKTNLKNVYVIDIEYYCSDDTIIEIFSDDFYKHAIGYNN